MDFSHYTDEPVALAVELVNTYEVFADEEHLRTPADVETFLRTHTHEWDGLDVVVTDQDLARLREVRNRLRSAITSGDMATSARLLNEILEAANARPRVSVHDGHPAHLHFEALDAPPVDWLAAVTAMGLGVVLVEEGLDRFGVCGSSTCDDVFVDTSRNKSRRHCSDTCTTRENVAAYRRRQRD